MGMILAIDPGGSGGTAVRDHRGYVLINKMPDTYPEIYQLLRRYRVEAKSAGTEITAYIEQVASMPGEGVKGARTFGEHMGHLEMGCYSLGIRIMRVMPKAWQRPLSLSASTTAARKPTRPKQFTTETERQDYETALKAWRRDYAKVKQARKNQIKEIAQERYPAIRVTLWSADALMILDWAIRQQGA